MSTEVSENIKFQTNKVSSSFAYQAKVFEAAKHVAQEDDQTHLQMHWSFNSDKEIVIDSLVRVDSSLPYVLYNGSENYKIDNENNNDGVPSSKRHRLTQPASETISSVSRQLENVKFNCCSDFNYQSQNDDWSIVIDCDKFTGKGIKTIQKLIKTFNLNSESNRFYRISLRKFSNIVIDTTSCSNKEKNANRYVARKSLQSVDRVKLTPIKDQANIISQIENILDQRKVQQPGTATKQCVILVNSVAGSGKTSTLHFLKQKKILYLAISKKLVAEGHAYGVTAQTICKFFMTAFHWTFREYVEAIEDLTSGNSFEKTLNLDHLDIGDDISYDIIFIDEVSLIPSALLRELTRVATKIGTIVLLVGDVNQLSAIGASENDLYYCLTYVDKVLFIKQHIRTNDISLIEILRQFEAGDNINETTLLSLVNRDVELTKLFNFDGSFKEFKFISKFNVNVLLINLALIKLRYVIFQTDTYFERCYLKNSNDERLSENDITVALQVGAPYICLIDTAQPKGTRLLLTKINRENKNGVFGVVSVDMENKNEGTTLTLYRSYHQYSLYGREHIRFGFPLLLDLAVSTHRCQGSTFNGLVFIEMDSMSRSEAYVCLSRATKLKNIQLL